MSSTGSPHVTDAEIERFRRRELPGAALVAFSDHAAECDECRARLMGASDLEVAEAAFDAAVGLSGGHVPEVEVHAYVDDGLDAARRREIDAHLERCGDCAEEIRDLQQFAAGSRTLRQRSTWWYIGMAAAAAIVLAATVSGLLRSREAPILMVLNDGTATIRVDALGHLNLADRLTSTDATRIREALVSRRLTVPAGVATSATAESRLRGEAGDAPFRVLAPLATAVLSDTPSFRWSPFADDAVYIVRLRDETAGAMINSPPVRAVEWVPSTPLARGHTYAWQVESSSHGQEYTAPAPPAPAASFIVLDATNAARLAQVPDSHLIRGILYADAGALDDAQWEFSALSAQNPTSDVVHDFLNQLAQARGLKPSTPRQ